MKNTLLILGLVASILFSSAMEMDDISNRSSQQIGWQRLRGYPALYRPILSSTLKEVRLTQALFSSRPIVAILLTPREKPDLGADRFRTELNQFFEKYSLDPYDHDRAITQLDGAPCLHAAIRLINENIPVPYEMAEEICKFMGASNPFFCYKAHEWLQEINLTYLQTMSSAEKHLQLARTVYKELKAKVQQMHTLHPLTPVNNFLKPVAAECEDLYGLDDFLTTLLCRKIIKNNPQDYILRNKMAHLTLVKGEPRDKAVDQGTIEYFQLPNRSFEDHQVLFLYWNQRAESRYDENRLGNLNFQLSASEFCAQALTRYCDVLRELYSLKKEITLAKGGVTG